MENLQGIRMVRLEPRPISLFCSIGQDHYLINFIVMADHFDKYPDYTEVDQWIRDMSGQHRSIESALEAVISEAIKWFGETAHIVVEGHAAAPTHMPVIAVVERNNPQEVGHGHQQCDNCRSAD